jgi:hypothetical protein
MTTTTKAGEIGRAAFYQTNIALSNLLSDAYPNGCTLADAAAWAANLSDETVEECEVLG